MSSDKISLVVIIILLWSLEHCMFASDCFIKSGELLALQRSVSFLTNPIFIKNILFRNDKIIISLISALTRLDCYLHIREKQSMYSLLLDAVDLG